MRLLNEFWAFVKERELIRLRRLHGLPRDQWTQDPIMQQYRFTNVKRHHDRTTIGLKKIYDAHFDWDDEATSWDDCVALLLNCVLFRFFGTVEAAEVIGYVRRWNREQQDRVEGYAIQNDLPFTSAYIVPNAGLDIPKYEMVIRVMNEMRDHHAHGVIYALQDEKGPQSWEAATDALTKCFGVGPFMAKEILLDYVLATGQTPKDWQTWTPVGPGGKRGAGWVLLGRKESLPTATALRVCQEVYASHEAHWPDSFTVGDGVNKWTHISENLDLTDIQFQFCEFDKYRKALAGKQPKRRFKPTIDRITDKTK